MSLKRPIDYGLEKLNGMINDMIDLAGKTLEISIESILTRTDNVEEVRKLSDQLMFMMDETSELAVQLIARFQPVASDLREIKSAIQVSYDFSRIGRYAANIAEIARMIPEEGCDFTSVRELSRIVLEMVREAGKAYLNKDLKKADELRSMDDQVDKLYAESMKHLIQMGGKINTACLLSIALILRYLERIADHACYIADATSYMITGRKY
ncbi:MAG: phosphate signaling complex protein PhoU [Thaumarchaeota archaeon]|jgi:phosphate transport system protein|nr:phosphate signaling complex protein PhoU [Candidatus Wolframiiraptor allenii]